MDSQEGIDEVYTLDYFDRTKIDGDINAYLGRNQLSMISQ
jgi:hypothetical protein